MHNCLAGSFYRRGESYFLRAVVPSANSLSRASSCDWLPSCNICTRRDSFVDPGDTILRNTRPCTTITLRDSDAAIAHGWLCDRPEMQSLSESFLSVHRRCRPRNSVVVMTADPKHKLTPPKSPATRGPSERGHALSFVFLFPVSIITARMRSTLAGIFRCRGSM